MLIATVQCYSLLVDTMLDPPFFSLEGTFNISATCMIFSGEYIDIAVLYAAVIMLLFSLHIIYNMAKTRFKLNY